jgi:hypothetical protein
VLGGDTPGVRTIGDARRAAIAGAERIMRFEDHAMKPELVHMLKKDIRPQMQVQLDPAASEIFLYWKGAALVGLNPHINSVTQNLPMLVSCSFFLGSRCVFTVSYAFMYVAAVLLIGTDYC